MMSMYKLVADALAQGERVALAVLIRVEGAAPRDAGTKMVVYADGRTAGTVGGGKLEALVTRDAVEAIRQGASRLVHYALRDVEAGDPGICGGEVDVFVDVAMPRPTLLVAGAGHVAVPVAEIGSLCEFRVVVVDDRPEMVSEDRFPHAERIAADIVDTLKGWPVSPQTHIVIVTRGHAQDEDALRAVIGSPAGYVGMIGSRRKVRTLLDRLRADGVDETLIRRVRSPIGLDIGAETPAEIAVSILAEVIMLRQGRSGQPMKLEP
jgi:xanthine dehydrogenase accessory factor